jgi:hypothetical protein
MCSFVDYLMSSSGYPRIIPGGKVPSSGCTAVVRATWRDLVFTMTRTDQGVTLTVCDSASGVADPIGRISMMEVHDLFGANVYDALMR